MPTNAIDNAPLPVVVIPKQWWKSVTHWINLAAFVLPLLLAPEIVELLGAALGVQVTAAIIAIANVLLRQFKTGAPIAGSPPDNAAPVASSLDARRAKDAKNAADQASG